MIPVALKLRNFCSYGSDVPELNFESFRLACLSGNNGVGKSSMLDSMTWALWGWSRAGDNSDRLVRLGAKEMSVEFEFDLEGINYRIRRVRKLTSTGQTILELFSKNKEGWVNLTEGTIKDTQEKINTLLHLSFDTFVNSSYLRQGRADEFTLKRPNERKEVLANILGLDQYELWEEKAKEKVKELNSKLSSLEYSLKELEEELSHKDNYLASFNQAETKVKEIEVQKKEIVSKRESLQKEKETLLVKDQNYQKLKENLEKIKEELEDIQKQGSSRSQRIAILENEINKASQTSQSLVELEDLEKMEKELSKKQEEILNLTTLKSTLSSKVAEKKREQRFLEEEIASLKKKISTLEEVKKCPTCGTDLNVTHREKVLGEITAEIATKQKTLDSLNINEEKELANIEKQIAEINYDSTFHKQTREKIALLEIAKKEREKIAANKAALEAEIRAREELRESYKKRKAEQEEYEKSLSQLPSVSADLEKVNYQLFKIDQEIKDTERVENEARDLYGQAKKMVERLSTLEKNRKEKIKEKDTYTNEKSIYEELSLAFSKRGIQAMLIEAAIPEIEEEANLILEKLTDGRMKVSLETQRENKTGGVVETLDIIISDEQGARPYELWSGGEAFRVNFAIRLAISKLLTHRAGAKLQFLIIDEGFGTQDAQGRDRLVEAINLIKNDFAKVLVITHIEELKEAFDTRIEISKGAEGSTFKLIEA